MKFYLDDVGLHDLGVIFLSDQASTGEPEDAPQRYRHTWRIKVKTRQPGYSDNADIMRRIRGAVLSQQEPVARVEDDNGTVYLNQTVRIVSHNLPESPNEKGTYLQSLEIALVFYENIDKSKTQCASATYQRTGLGTPVITLDTVESFKYSTDVSRYSKMRKHREHAAGKLEVRGLILGNPQASVAQRRAELLAAFTLIQSEIHDGADGTIQFGPFNQVVRVDSFTADIDQAGPKPHISYSLSASYSDFPNEAGYAQAEFTITTREDVKEGKTFKLLSGQVGAHNEAAALTKLTSLQAIVGSGFAATRREKRSEQLSGEDGATFIRLTFDEEYEAVSSTATSWELRIADTEETRASQFRRVYSGWVEAKAATFDAAYHTAADKARALGDRKHQFKLGGQISVDDKQLSAERQMTGDMVVRVEFSYEYQLSGVRVYAEIGGEFTRETFGLDQETVSGFVACADVSTARSVYATLKAGYGTYVLRGERVREDRQKIENVTTSPVTPIGATRTPGTLTEPVTPRTWAPFINSSEVADAAESANPAGVTPPPVLNAGGKTYVRQFTRLDFSFEVHRPKAAGAVAFAYEMDVQQDWIARQLVTTISGTVTAATEAEAAEYLDAFIDDADFGSRMTTRRRHAYLKKPAGKADYTQGLVKRANSGSVGSTYQTMQFEEVFRKKLAGAAAILQCSLDEEIDCSGARVVIKPTAESTDVFQECGLQSGRRTISGECVATDETTALAWVKTQQTLPLSTGFAAAGETADERPRLSFVPEWEPLVDGVTRGAGVNANLVRVRFTFTRYYETLTLA